MDSKALASAKRFITNPPAAFTGHPPKTVSFYLSFVVMLALLALGFFRQLSFSSRADSLITQSRVTLVLVSDRKHHVKYASQERSIACYAETHGYDFASLEPRIHAPTCYNTYQMIQFQKPCTVGKWLLNQPEDSRAVVFDGDVIGGTSNSSLRQWIENPYDLTYDLAFYERSWNFEVASGNYIVRNTPFSRLFLHHWASFETIHPKGYASTDNGAIHLAIVDALALKGRQRCRDLYRALEAPVTNLQPYFEFVACVKALLGPPRVYEASKPTLLTKKGRKIAEDSNVAGIIVIFPRLFGFVVDSVVHGLLGANRLHPFHHGWKTDEWQERYLGFKEREKGARCTPFSTNKTLSPEKMAEKLEASDKYYVHLTGHDFSIVPRWLHVDEDCFKNLWCPPLPTKPSKWPHGVVAETGKIVAYKYQDPGVDFHNHFLAGLYAGEM
ncbi:unnamed protein product [Agarophyton chilense]